MNRKKKVTLSIDSDIYDSFRQFCEENAIMLSKKIEIFMKNEVGAKDPPEKKEKGEKGYQK